MPTWEGDPRPIEPDPPRYTYADSYHYRREEPQLVRPVNTSDALEAIAGIFWFVVVLVWTIVVGIIKFIIWIVRKTREAHMARRSPRHRG